MKKKLVIPEEVKFEHEVIVEFSDEIDIDEILDDLDGCDGLDEVTYKLKRAGIKILEVSRDQDGADWEIGYIETEDVDEED